MLTNERFDDDDDDFGILSMRHNTTLQFRLLENSSVTLPFFFSWSVMAEIGLSIDATYSSAERRKNF